MRARSSGRSGWPASISASRVQVTAHFWPASIASPTRGGTGSFQRAGSHANDRTQPPIFE